MKQDDKLIALCRELIRRPSVSGEEQAAAEYLRSTMLSLGYHGAETDRYGSVLGCIRGSRPGPAILLDGHIDTVPVGDPALWTHDPFAGEIQGDRLYGRGTSDMKGSVAAMVLAAARFAKDTGGDFQGTIWVSCSVQEERFEGVACREIARLAQPDYVIVGEATGTALNIGQRGRAEVVVETRGVSCHSANPEKGVNAVYHMAELIGALRRLPPPEHPLLGKGILELTDIISEPYPGASVVPALCRATFDRRLLPGETPESILSPIQEAAADLKTRLPQLDVRAYLSQGSSTCWTGEVMEAERFFPAWVLPEDHPLVQGALRGLQEAGLDAPLSHYAFCTNASSFCGELGIPTVGFGPSRENLAHTADEYIEISQLERACRGFQGILRALTVG